MMKRPVSIVERADHLWAVGLPGEEQPEALLPSEEEAISAARHLHPWSIARMRRCDGKSATVLLGNTPSTTSVIE